MSEVRNMMLEDSKDLLDNVEVTTVADECVKLKKIEDEIAAIEAVSYTHLTLPTTPYV